MTSEIPAADETIEALRLRLAPAVASAAVFDGWSAEAVAQAASECGVDPDLAAYAFSGGQMAMIEAWIASVDRAMLDAVPADALASMPVRAKIRTLVLARLDAIAGLEEALVRARAIMAMPQNAARAVKLGWKSADLMWRLAGDTATDYNHYTKRAILGGVYAATLAAFTEDESPDKVDTRAFLDRRIEGIMRFEKTKAKIVGGGGEHFSLSRFLGRLRYPAR